MPPLLGVVMTCPKGEDWPKKRGGKGAISSIPMILPEKGWKNAAACGIVVPAFFVEKMVRIFSAEWADCLYPLTVIRGLRKTRLRREGGLFCCGKRLLIVLPNRAQ